METIILTISFSFGVIIGIILSFKVYNEIKNNIH